MLLLSRQFVLLLTILGLVSVSYTPTAFAKNNRATKTVCDEHLEEEKESFVDHSILSLQQAQEIIGEMDRDGVSGLFAFLFHYMNERTFDSYAQALGTLEMFLQAIQSRMVDADWTFVPFQAQDDSRGFVGSAGHALIMKSSGVIYKGKISTFLFTEDGSRRLVDYDRLRFAAQTWIKAPAELLLEEAQAMMPATDSFGAKNLVHKADQYMLEHAFTNREHALKTLDTLFKAISTRVAKVMRGWAYRAFEQDGVRGFYGDQGFARVIKPTGEIYNARVTFDQNTWKYKIEYNKLLGQLFFLQK